MSAPLNLLLLLLLLFNARLSRYYRHQPSHRSTHENIKI